MGGRARRGRCASRRARRRRTSARRVVHRRRVGCGAGRRLPVGAVVSPTGASESAGPLRIAVLCPHFAPDTAPTGEVITAIVHELAALGHELHVVTSLPWYRDHAVEPAWAGRLVRRETTPWGSVTRIHPFATRD